MKKSWVVILIAESILLIAAGIIGYGIYTGRFGDLFFGSDEGIEAAVTPRPSPPIVALPGDRPSARPLVTATATLEEGGIVVVEQTLAFPYESETLRGYLFAMNYAEVTLLSIGSDYGLLGYSREGPNLTVELEQPGSSFHLSFRIILPRDDSIMAARPNLVLMNKVFCTPVYYEDGAPYMAFLHPQFGSPFVYPATDYRVTLRADPAYALHGPGKNSDRVVDGWREARFHHDGLRDMPMVASQGARVTTSTFEGIPVVYIGSADTRPAVEDALKAAKRIGPYPYDSLVVVRVPAISGAAQWGMEMSGMILLSDALFRPDNVNALLEVTYHEVFHQWFYGAVGINKMATPAIDEGLVTFLTRWLAGRPAEPAQVPVSVFSRGLREYGDRTAYQSGAYTEAARFYASLYDRLGEDGFFAFLSRIYSEYYGKILSYSDFLRLLREVG
jgi:hypothetical protein